MGGDEEVSESGKTYFGVSVATEAVTAGKGLEGFFELAELGEGRKEGIAGYLAIVGPVVVSRSSVVEAKEANVAALGNEVAQRYVDELVPGCAVFLDASVGGVGTVCDCKSKSRTGGGPGSWGCDRRSAVLMGCVGLLEGLGAAGGGKGVGTRRGRPAVSVRSVRTGKVESTRIRTQVFETKTPWVERSNRRLRGCSKGENQKVDMGNEVRRTLSSETRKERDHRREKTRRRRV